MCAKMAREARNKVDEMVPRLRERERDERI